MTFYMMIIDEDESKHLKQTRKLRARLVTRLALPKVFGCTKSTSPHLPTRGRAASTSGDYRLICERHNLQAYDDHKIGSSSAMKSNIDK